MPDFIEVFRFIRNKECSIGLMRFNHRFVGHTLEKPYEDNIRFHSSIPTGVFKFDKYTSRRYGVTVRLVIPHRDNIIIHPGNSSKDSSGCILVGEYDRLYRIKNSRIVFGSFQKMIKDTFYGLIKITDI